MIKIIIVKNTCITRNKTILVVHVHVHVYVCMCKYYIHVHVHNTCIRACTCANIYIHIQSPFSIQVVCTIAIFRKCTIKLYA